MHAFYLRARACACATMGKHCRRLHFALHVFLFFFLVGRCRCVVLLFNSPFVCGCADAHLYNYKQNETLDCTIHIYICICMLCMCMVVGASIYSIRLCMCIFHAAAKRECARRDLGLTECTHFIVHHIHTHTHTHTNLHACAPR